MEIRDYKTSFTPKRGDLLISEPFLLDMNFRRSVVLLTEHNEEGSVGFVLNRQLTGVGLNELAPDLIEYNFPVFYGGPVEQNTLHFIHRSATIPEAQEIADGIYWGGSLEYVNEMIRQKLATPDEFRFFIGYSGWSHGQLMDEIDAKAWWVIDAKKELVFTDDYEALWQKVVRELGSEYAHMANPPEDPSFN